MDNFNLVKLWDVIHNFFRVLYNFVVKKVEEAETENDNEPV